MKTLVISDLHIGDPRIEDNLIVLDVLKNEKYDQIVLNGDIVELWLSKIDHIRDNIVIKELAKIAKTKKVIWVLGNHDFDARGQKIIPGAIEEGSFRINEKKRVLCIHGHQVYEFQNMSWITRVVIKINYYMWKAFGINIQGFFQNGVLYRWMTKYRRSKILERYGDDVDTIIIGHTHLVGYTSTNKTQLYDIGSLVLRKTYAIVDNGYIEIKKAIKRTIKEK